MAFMYYPVSADPKDQRDLFYESTRPEDTALKESVDLREWATTIESQSTLRSCTSQAVVGAYELMLKKQYPEKFTELSPLFVYYNTRIMEGIKAVYDSGVYIKDALRAVKLQGICAESIWPYDVASFSSIPNLASYKDAKTRRIKNYRKCKNLTDMLDALSDEIPVVVGMKIYSSFNSIGWNGFADLTMPTMGDQLIGGHAVALVGYNSADEKFIARNSFGSAWGDYGYFYIPFEYASKYFIDGWVFDLDVE
jgi:C1A family cysteine protease